MKELMGGLWIAGLLGWACLGIVPGLICLGLGSLAGAGELYRLRQLNKAEASWRKNYPKYRY